MTCSFPGCPAHRTRLYPVGWRCRVHTPAMLLGIPEPGRAAYCAPNRCYHPDHRHEEGK